MNNSRLSNFELIRIVAMSAIIIHHFLYHCITPETMTETVYRCVNPWFLIGVNMFFILSGWFTVKFSLKKLLTLVLIIACYNIVNVIGCFAVGQPVTSDTFWSLMFFPVAQSPYWFLKVYIFIMLLSPILNRGLEKLPLPFYRRLLIILTIAVVYSCNMGENEVNSDGRSLFQGLYMYIVGYYLRADKRLYEKLKMKWCWAGYLLCGAITVVSGALIPDFGFIDLKNSLPMMLEAVFIFLALSKLRFNSRFVNLLGSASLGCYMLQEGVFGNFILYPRMHWKIVHSDDLTGMILLFAALFIGYWLFSLILNPVIRYISDFIARKITGFKPLAGIKDSEI